MSSFKFPASLLCDMYKLSHREQYPIGTEVVYSTWTARMSRISGIDKVVAFGFQAFIKEYLITYFNENFFARSEKEIEQEYKRYIKYTLGVENPNASHVVALHKLGYLPLEIRAVKEGTIVPIRVPMLTIKNTHPEFSWVTNYIETLMSNNLWMCSTSATIAFEYRKKLNKWAKETGGDLEGVQFAGHDFSMRGMSGIWSACLSGAGHLLSFVGTDTIPAIGFLEQFYNANIENELVGTSIPATEHSVMCSYGQNEREAYKRIVTEIYPNGFVSIVSDTWDLWKVLTEVIPSLKDEIMTRDGKVVIRPDSGDPVKIVCGDPNSDNLFARKGVIELLWDTFGGTLTSKGYKQLDPHIGCIYGDAITLERCEEICKQLAAKGFASTNMVYGIGSYTYQHNTRDTFGFALKSTYVKINGQEMNIFKDPVTDDAKFKKSQTGLVAVVDIGGHIEFIDGLNLQEQSVLENKDLLETIFVNGELLRDDNLSDIRNRLMSQL